MTEKRTVIFRSSILSLFTFMTVICQAATIQLPDTGQTTQFATGDDGDIRAGVAWPTPRFNDNANGTLTDSLTGLVWLKDANCAKTIGYDPDNKGDGTMSWTHALDFVAGVNMGTYSSCAAGHYDWRLPNINELESLVNAEAPNNATWLTNQGFTNVQVSYPPRYWSSTTHALWAGNAWYIDMTVGMIDFLGVQYSSSTSHVWLVRGSTSPPAALWKTGQTISNESGDDGDLQEGAEWPDQRFLVTYCDGIGPCTDQTSDCDGDASNDVMTDNLTGLVWTRDANLPNGKLTWKNALAYANSLAICGISNDWHLPNRKELRSLVNYGEHWSYAWLGFDNGFLNVIGDDQNDYYWSSTTYAPLTTRAWYVRMLDGKTHPAPLYHGGKTDTSYVWPVSERCSNGSSAPAPYGQKSMSYPPLVKPSTCADLSLARPIGVGAVASNGDAISITVALAQFSKPVDIYLALYAPVLNANLLIIQPDLSFQPYPAGLVPWKAGTSGGLEESLYGNIPVAALPPGTYTLYAALSPSGNMSSIYVWSTAFTIP